MLWKEDIVLRLPELFLLSDISLTWTWKRDIFKRKFTEWTILVVACGMLVLTFIHGHGQVVRCNTEQDPVWHSFQTAARHHTTVPQHYTRPPRWCKKTAPAFSDVDSAVPVKCSKQAIVCLSGCLSVTPAEVRDFRAKGLQAVDNGS